MAERPSSRLDRRIAAGTHFMDLENERNSVQLGLGNGTARSIMSQIHNRGRSSVKISRDWLEGWHALTPPRLSGDPVNSLRHYYPTT